MGNDQAPSPTIGSNITARAPTSRIFPMRIRLPNGTRSTGDQKSARQDGVAVKPSAGSAQPHTLMDRRVNSVRIRPWTRTLLYPTESAQIVGAPAKTGSGTTSGVAELDHCGAPPG